MIGIDITEELTKIFAREVAKEFARSYFLNYILNKANLDSAIETNMYAYDLCIEEDSEGAIEALDRIVKIQMLNIKNKWIIFLTIHFRHLF